MKHLATWKKVLIICIAAGLLVGGAVLIWAATIRLPDVSSFEARKIANSSKITDRTGEVVLYDINQGVRRSEIPLDQMGTTIQHAVVAIEDEHFYQHNGIRPTSILRAVMVNVFHGSFSQGGSTITQQIIKNTLLNSNKNIVRKFKEWILALRLERQFSKEQILAIYLNDAPFGGTIYGVQEAAKAFFNKDAKDLTIAEASYMAAMIPAPTYYAPNGIHRDKLDARHLLVLKKMYENNYLTDAEYASAQTEVVTFNAQINNSIKAPHFVFYILDYLQKKYGEDVMEHGGYTIKTTLDWELQQKGEELAKKYAELNEKKYRASNNALVAIDPTTGQILTMVGSRDYFDKTIDGAYNVAVAERQPGSSFKPFVYLTAFAEGYTPETILFDVPTEFSTNCSADRQPLPGHIIKDCYHPDNFDNKFKGPISLRSAIAESRNVPSVKLLYLVGVDSAVDTAHKLGITTLQNPKEIGLSLVLGGGEVKLLDMVSAYGTFANSGIRNPATGILEVQDHDGAIIEQFEESPTEVIEKNAVLTLNDVLSDPIARRPTFGESITLPGVAVKTGTTNEDRDAWIIGYTPQLVVGVWSGNNTNTSMTSGGGAVSGPLWKEFMQTGLQKIPSTSFEKPLPDPDYENLKPILRGIWSGNRAVQIDKVTGMLATDATPIESRIEKVITDVQDILYWVKKDDPRGPAPANPNNDPQFHLWNPPVQNWWYEKQGLYPVTTDSDIPVQYDTVHTTDTKPVTIKGLPDSMKAEATTTITISTKSEYPLNSVDLYLNNNYITTLSSPFRFVFTPSQYGYLPGTYTFKAVGTDSIYAKSTAEQSLILK